MGIVEVHLCPVCGAQANEKYKVPASKLRSELGTYFNTSVPPEVEIDDYILMVCTGCGLEFSHPQKEGSGSFYSWVTKQKNYYPVHRWEYDEVLRIIGNGQGRSLLDVGCGDGRFLDVAASAGTGLKTVGIDPTVSSIEKCLAKGHTAYSVDTMGFKAAYPGVLFDHVVSFHCLEHIGNPASFVQELLSLLKEDGVMFLSTPYSPMSVEVGWFDILNHPPHHMSRWNMSAYRELAKKLDLKIEFYSPEPVSTLKRSVISYMMEKKGMLFFNSQRSLSSMASGILQDPFRFLHHYKAQQNREKLNGSAFGDVVLVKLTRA